MMYITIQGFLMITETEGICPIELVTAGCSFYTEIALLSVIALFSFIYGIMRCKTKLRPKSTTAFCHHHVSHLKTFYKKSVGGNRIASM